MEQRGSKQYVKSSRREEYVFLGAIVQEAWKRDVDLTILRSQTDADGYDLVPETDAVTRHVQLKTSGTDGKTSSQKHRRSDSQLLACAACIDLAGWCLSWHKPSSTSTFMWIKL
jgi:hypothetical protein